MVQTQHLAVKIIDPNQPGRPIEVINARGIGAGGDAVEFTHVAGTCDRLTAA